MPLVEDEVGVGKLQVFELRLNGVTRGSLEIEDTAVGGELFFENISELSLMAARLRGDLTTYLKIRKNKQALVSSSSNPFQMTNAGIKWVCTSFAA